MVMEGNMGIGLIDEFGLFLGNVEKKDIEVLRVRLYSHPGFFSLFLTMKDHDD